MTRVLVTNDDGIESAGLHLLAAGLDEFVVAEPDLPLLPPPHAAGGRVAASMRRHNAQSLRRFLSKPVPNIQHSNPSDTQTV